MADFRILFVGLKVSLITVPHLLAQLQQRSTARAHSQSAGWAGTPHLQMLPGNSSRRAKVQRYQILCFHSVFNAWHLLCTLVAGDSSHIFSFKLSTSSSTQPRTGSTGFKLNQNISEPEKSKCALEGEMLIKS